MFKDRKIEYWRKKSTYGGLANLIVFCYLFNVEMLVFQDFLDHKSSNLMGFVRYRGINIDEDLNSIEPPKKVYLILMGYHYWVIVPDNISIPKLNVTIKNKRH